MKKLSGSRPAYRIEIGRAARKQLLQLPTAVKHTVQAAIGALGENPRPHGVKRLKGREGYRIRIGDYRVKYSIFDNILLVEVVQVGQRSNFYDE